MACPLLAWTEISSSSKQRPPFCISNLERKLPRSQVSSSVYLTSTPGRLGEHTIDIDRASFGHQVVEIETMSEADDADISAAGAGVATLARSLGISGEGGSGHPVKVPECRETLKYTVVLSRHALFCAVKSAQSMEKNDFCCNSCPVTIVAKKVIPMHCCDVFCSTYWLRRGRWLSPFWGLATLTVILNRTQQAPLLSLPSPARRMPYLLVFLPLHLRASLSFLRAQGKLVAFILENCPRQLEVLKRSVIRLGSQSFHSKGRTSSRYV